MKRETLRNGLTLTVLSMTICLSAAVSVTSCQKQSFEEESPAPRSAMNKTELPYLDFTTGYDGTGIASDENWEVIMQLAQRVKLSKESGLWEANVRSADEINVSPEVFAFLTQTIENSNAKILAHLTARSIMPRKLIPGEGDPLEEPTRSDCVASCFGWIHDKMGFGPSYDSTNSWINSTFGSGVPSSQMESTLKHFYGPNNVSSFPVNSQNNGYIYKGTNSAVILNYQVNDSTGHAVIYGGTSNGTHWVTDPQNGAMDLVDPSDVISAYEVRQ